MKDKLINSYMECAETFSKLSSAKRLKVGSIIVKDNRIISIGYNGTPAGWESNVCEDENDKTLPEVIHAEMNCINKLAKSNESGENSIMFITHSPCMECSKSIYGAGIKTVYYKNKYRDDSGIKFLVKCGITVNKIESSLENPNL
jgi:dCMP deaminase